MEMKEHLAPTLARKDSQIGAFQQVMADLATHSLFARGP
jgi:hypothetical protein